MKLTNHITGETLEMTFRPLCPADIPEAINCIREAYGDTYVKPYLYTEEGFLAHSFHGNLSFSVAQAPDGALGGIIAHETSPLFPGQAEIACQVIHRSASGYGLALPLALYQLRQAEKEMFSSYFARALGCHVISQKTLAGMGFTHCGFLPSVFDKTQFHTLYQTGRNLKISQTVAARRGTKSDAGPLSLPDRLVPLARLVYDGMGMSWRLRGTVLLPPGEGRWEQTEDLRHKVLTLWARQLGDGFAQALSARIAPVRDRPLQAVNLFLNLSSPGAAQAVQMAQAQGFLATGFLPGGQDGEYLILHHPLNTPFDVDQIPYLSDYKPFAAEIRRQCS